MSPRGEPKKPRVGSASKPQRTYAESASADLAIAVTAASGSLSQQDVDYIQGAFTDRLFEQSLTQLGTAGPAFKGKPVHADGVLKIWCRDSAALEWLRAAVASITLPRGEALAIKRQNELPRMVLGGILLPGVWEAGKAGRVLGFQNLWAQVHRWRLLKVQQQETGTFIVVGLPEDLVGVLMEHGRELALVVGSVYLKFQGPRGRFSAVSLDKPDPTRASPTVTERMDETAAPATSTEDAQPSTTVASRSPSDNPGLNEGGGECIEGMGGLAITSEEEEALLSQDPVPFLTL